MRRVTLMCLAMACLLAPAAPALATPPTTVLNGQGEQVVPGLKEVVAVKGGPQFGLALTNKGTVEAWGSNEEGQLGNGTLMEPYPSDANLISGLSEVTAIAGGGASGFGLALLRNGTVMEWGADVFGNAVTTPTRVPTLSGVVEIAAGGGSRVARLSNGAVMSWGEGSLGQLGNGTSPEQPTREPKQVSGLSGVTAISVGGTEAPSTLALLSNGTVMAWGDNIFGQLGIGNNTGPEQCETGKPGQPPYPCSKVPVAVNALTDVTAISARGEYSLALLIDGRVMAWGNNASGQLDDGVKNGPEQCVWYTESWACSKSPVASSYTSLASGFYSIGPIPEWTYNQPRSVAFDPNGNLWFTDSGNDRVIELSASDHYLRQIGNEGTGPGQFTFSTEPWEGGIAANSSGAVYVASGNGRIEEFSAAGEYLRQFGNTGSTDERVGSVKGLAVDSSENVWIAERTKVKEYSSVGKYVGAFGVEGTGNGQLKVANGIAVSEGHIYIAEGLTNDRVQEFTTSGEYVRQFDQHGTGNGKSFIPDAISADPSTGNLYVCDLNGSTQEFTPQGAFVAKFDTEVEGYLARAIAVYAGEMRLTGTGLNQPW